MRKDIKSGQIAAEIVSECVPKDGLILAVCDNWEFNGDSKRELLLNGYVDFIISQDFFRQEYLPLICPRELFQLGQRPEANEAGQTFIICMEWINEILIGIGAF